MKNTRTETDSFTLVSKLDGEPANKPGKGKKTPLKLITQPLRA